MLRMRRQSHSTHSTTLPANILRPSTAMGNYRNIYILCCLAVLLPYTEAAVGTDCTSGADACITGEICVSDACGCNSANGYIDQSGTCSLADCGAPTPPTNGAVDASGGTEYNNEATLSCDTGYDPDADATATTTCKADGDWTTTTYTCTIKDCGAPTPPTNGAVDASGGTEYNNEATLSCDTGYDPDADATATTTCKADGDWTTTTYTCTIKDCGAPTPPTNGAVDASGGTEYNNEATLSCDTGYDPDADATATTTCKADGDWTTTTYTCTIKDCGAPTPPTNGAVDASGGTEYNNEATLSCDTGYDPDADATATTTCKADGDWTTTTYTCTIKDCGAPTPPTNGAVDASGGTEYNKEATLSCDTGYDPDADATATTTCKEDGDWTTTTYTCTIKDCADPTVPANSNVTLTVVGVTTYGANATVSCSAGFTCNGELTCAITCELTGWTSVVCSGAASIVSGVVLIGVCGLVSVLFHL